MENKSPAQRYLIVPYTLIDGIATFKDSEIKALYERVYEDEIQDLLFHDGTIPSWGHFLYQVVKAPGVLFHVIYDKGEIVGMFWLNRIEQTHAYCHFVAFKKYWGTGTALRAGKEAMQYCFDQLGFKTILGLLPTWNTFAREYLKHVGLKEVGEVPNLLWSEAKQTPVNGIVMYITKEDLS